uniref:Uncharacterized protein n=1 Tax=Herelleviridae sp. cttEB8 TaxID=2825832 RepID=A0A8S5P6U0_9CAUD|nr:MAG TPA: hypothetical protein [Herelleviridae sp. cttEB8]
MSIKNIPSISLENPLFVTLNKSRSSCITSCMLIGCFSIFKSNMVIIYMFTLVSIC